MTLVEMLVACALFLTFLTLAGGLVVHMFQCYRQGEAIVRPLQEARSAMGLMTSVIRSAIKINAPTSALLANGTNLIEVEIYTDATRYVRFLTPGDGTARYQELYQPGGMVKSERAMVRDCRKLNFRKLPRDPVVVIDLETSVGQNPPTPFSLQTLFYLRMPNARNQAN